MEKYEYEYLSLEKNDGYAVITITRKPANALTIETAINIARLVDELGKDDEIKVIIITGGIRFSFFTGSDLDEIYGIMNMNGDVTENMVKASKPVQDAFNAIANSPKLTIAAVNGITIGLGVELALACDIRIANELAWFKLAQTTIGIIPGAGGTQRLPRIIGEARAKELILTGRKVNADEAYRIGLVNKVVPPGIELSASIQMAKNVVRDTGAEAVRLAKKAISCSFDMEISEGMDKEMELLGLTYKSVESFKGIKGAMAGKKGVFKDI